MLAGHRSHGAVQGDHRALGRDAPTGRGHAGTGVGRLVCITGIGAGDSKGRGPWWYNWLVQPLVLRGVYHDKTRQEAVVRGGGLDWTLVRPVMLTNGPAKGVAAVRASTDPTERYAGTISRADVADWCLGELADGRHRGQAPVITN